MGFRTGWCGREDLNLHPVARTSTSSWRVYLIPPRPRESFTLPEPHLVPGEGAVDGDDEIVDSIGHDRVRVELGDGHDRRQREDRLFGLLVELLALGRVGGAARGDEQLVDVGCGEAR